MLARRELLVVAVITVATAVASVVAAYVDGSAVTAAIGGALVLLYLALERAFAAWGRHGSFGRGVAVGLAGMTTRLAVVLGCLVAVAMLDREGFAACAITFLAVFTLYLIVGTSVLAARAGR